MILQALGATGITATPGLPGVNTPPAPTAAPTVAALTSGVSAESPAATGERAAPKEAIRQLHGAVQAANDVIKPINSEIRFSIDEESGTTVVKVTNTATEEVIRQIPSEEMLNIARALDKIQGLLIEQKA